MQHDSKRSFTVQTIQPSSEETLRVPLLLDEKLLSLINGGFAASMTEPPTPINLAVELPHGPW